MQCDSNKICGWITAVSQLSVALCVLYVGYLANRHLERMVQSWEVTAEAVHKMQQDVARMESNVRSLDKRIYEMNHQMRGVRRNMTPFGMMRGMIP
jgi:cell division protein FtsX